MTQHAWRMISFSRTRWPGGFKKKQEEPHQQRSVFTVSPQRPQHTPVSYDQWSHQHRAQNGTLRGDHAFLLGHNSNNNTSRLNSSSKPWQTASSVSASTSGFYHVQGSTSARSRRRWQDPFEAAARLPWVLVYDSAAVTCELHDPATAVLYYRPRGAPSPGGTADGSPDALSARTALAGQLAGALTFASSCFALVRTVRLKRGTVAIRTEGRFVLMLCGRSPEWAEERLSTLSGLLRAACGGLTRLWRDGGRDRLTPLMDSLVVKAFPDVVFGDEFDLQHVTDTSCSVSPTVMSPFSDVSNTSSTGGGRRRDVVPTRDGDNTSLQGTMDRLYTLLGTAPTLHMTKSALCGVFLRSQRTVEACVLQRGVLGGVTLYRDRLLSSQLEDDLTRVLVSLVSSGSTEGSERSSRCESPEADSLEAAPAHSAFVPTTPLQALPVDYDLPHGVQVHTMYLPQLQHRALQQHLQQYQCCTRPRDRRHGGLRSQASTSFDLTTLRNVLLHHQSLHNYPTALPGVCDPSSLHTHHSTFDDTASINSSSINNNNAQGHHHHHHHSLSSHGAGPPTLDPLQLCAKISRNSDLLTGDLRPSQSLPGSPRKIRVAAMLPDVGNNSPDLRYKVLNAKRSSKPGGVSSTNTPRRFNPTRGSGLPRKDYSESPSGSPYPDPRNPYPESPPMSVVSSLPRRTNKLSPPSLSLSYDNDQDNQHNNSQYGTGRQDYSSMDYGNKFSQKGGSKSRFSVKSGDSGFEEMAKSDAEMNLKNTKNMLNLQFAPGKINRPQDSGTTTDGDVGRAVLPNEKKISEEINGNVSKSVEGTGGGRSKTQLLEDIRRMAEEEDSSRSESEISVLDLSSIVDVRENEKEDENDVDRNKEGSNEYAETHDTEKPGYHHLRVSVDPHNTTGPSYCEGVGGDASPLSPPEVEECERVCLYRHTTSNTTLCLLLHEDAARDPRLIYTLWGIGEASLIDLECQLERSMEVSSNSQQNSQGGDPFVRKFGQSVSAVEPASLDLLTIEKALMHFNRRPEVLELTLRLPQSTVWGHRLASSLTFYQHCGGGRAGPPIPSDPMAKLPGKARRRLERDHAVTLL